MPSCLSKGDMELGLSGFFKKTMDELWRNKIYDKGRISEPALRSVYIDVGHPLSIRVQRGTCIF